MDDVAALQELCENKTLALVGGSSRLLETKDGAFIDAHDIVVRINFGYPRDKEEYLGSRTDVLMMGGWFDDANQLIVTGAILEERYHPEIVILLNTAAQYEEHGIVDTNIIQQHYDDLLAQPYTALRYTSSQWSELYSQVGSLPSSGCMAIDVLVTHAHFAKLRLFGFDFFEVPSWYTEKASPKHVGSQEAKYVKSLQETHNIVIQGAK